MGAPAVDSGRVLAVRGPHTAAALGVADAPQGDPGLLVGLFQRRPPTARGVVVVPHFMSFGAQAAVAQLRRCQVEGWTVVPPTSPVRDVVAAIAGAELAICSSRHGVVTAHALGVPVVLAEFAGPQEPRFKYDDHFAALGLTAAHVPLQAILDDGLGAHQVRRTQRPRSFSRGSQPRSNGSWRQRPALPEEPRSSDRYRLVVLSFFQLGSAPVAFLAWSRLSHTVDSPTFSTLSLALAWGLALAMPLTLGTPFLLPNYKRGLSDDQVVPSTIWILRVVVASGVAAAAAGIAVAVAHAAGGASLPTLALSLGLAGFACLAMALQVQARLHLRVRWMALGTAAGLSLPVAWLVAQAAPVQEDWLVPVAGAVLLAAALTAATLLTRSEPESGLTAAAREPLARSFGPRCRSCPTCSPSACPAGKPPGRGVDPPVATGGRATGRTTES